MIFPALRTSVMWNSLYADDRLLYFACKSVASIEHDLTLDLGNVICWLCFNFLSLNVNKTKVMLMGTHPRLSQVGDLTVQAEGHNLERVEKFKYVGVMSDQNLSWKEHVENI